MNITQQRPLLLLTNTVTFGVKMVAMMAAIEKMKNHVIEHGLTKIDGKIKSQLVNSFKSNINELILCKKRAPKIKQNL